MIANIKILKSYCSEYTQIENYTEATNSPLKYDLHHRREITEHKSKKQLITENLYYHRPSEELIFLEHGEHIRMHKKGKHRPAFSIEWKQKMSDAKKNVSAETRQKISDAKKGKHRPAFSTKWKQKMSNARKGKHWHLENGKHVYTD